MPTAVAVNLVKARPSLMEEGLVLMLPIDTNGDVVNPTYTGRVKTMEAWEFCPSRPREREPSICDPRKAAELYLALIKHPDDDVLTALYAYIPTINPVDFKKWCMCLHRAPSKDLYDFVIELTYE